jgi:hypothetical protein
MLAGGAVSPAAFHEHLAPRITSMLVARPIRLELRVGDDISGARLGKAVAVASTSN